MTNTHLIVEAVERVCQEIFEEAAPSRAGLYAHNFEITFENPEELNKIGGKMFYVIPHRTQMLNFSIRVREIDASPDQNEQRLVRSFIQTFTEEFGRRMMVMRDTVEFEKRIWKRLSQLKTIEKLPPAVKQWMYVAARANSRFVPVGIWTELPTTINAEDVEYLTYPVLRRTTSIPAMILTGIRLRDTSVDNIVDMDDLKERLTVYHVKDIVTDEIQSRVELVEDLDSSGHMQDISAIVVRQYCHVNFAQHLQGHDVDILMSLMTRRERYQKLEQEA